MIEKPVKDLKIVFMGTPDFAVASLSALIDYGCNVAAVITAPDKPAGRGMKIQETLVKRFAVDRNIKVLQPEKLKDEHFLNELKKINADLQIVVAFRMLPEVVWDMPRLGTINLHASLLPQYRGAAPINWALINGENRTGVTTFFLQHEIDTGDILLRKEVNITDEDNAGSLHDKLMNTGAGLLCETVELISQGNYQPVPQINDGLAQVLKSAPKIFRDDCRIDWKQPAKKIRNHIRGLSPYPAAWSELVSVTGEKISIKIFDTDFIEKNHTSGIGTIESDQKSNIYVFVPDGIVEIKFLQIAGKRKMTPAEFLPGFRDIQNWRLE